MSKVKTGDLVQVHYTGKFPDGEVFDSSEGKAPLEFVVGNRMVIPGFDNGMVDMEINEKKTLEIPAEDAYGTRRDDMIVTVNKTDFPEDQQPEMGMQFQLTHENGGVIVAEVTEVGDETVILDANHPLADKDLVFEVELVSISDAPPAPSS